jgi:DNA repair protein RecO (recombination protein O)
VEAGAADNLPAAGRPRARAAARRLEDQTGYVLHMYPYSETSLIVETFTRAHGRVPLLAKGAKRPRSALRGVLMQFQRVGLSWSGKGDLRTLTRAEWLGGIPALAQAGLFCGFYLNELLLKLLARDDPHERLFDSYESALTDLAHGMRGSRVLRQFEKGLLKEIGYEMNLRFEADTGSPLDPEARYVYHPERGLRRLDAGERSDAALSGACALAIDADDYRDPATATAARHLMRAVIEHQLNGRPLATRQIFFALQHP